MDSLETSVERYFKDKPSYTLSTKLQHAFKRSLDLVVGSLGLVVSSPLIGLMAAATLYDSGNPVLFKQKRYGYRGEKITIYKIRVMHNGTEEKMKSGELKVSDVYNGHNHPVYTKFGKLFDYTHLNELPQLWNVVKGEMSIVGNRPLPTYILKEYMENSDCLERFASKPGLLGHSQLFSRPLDINDAVKREIGYSTKYQNGNILAEDLKIMMLTIRKYCKICNEVKNRYFANKNRVYSILLTVDMKL